MLLLLLRSRQDKCFVGTVMEPLPLAPVLLLHFSFLKQLLVWLLFIFLDLNSYFHCLIFDELGPALRDTCVVLLAGIGS